MAHQSTGYVMNAEVGQPHGVAPLDDKGKLLSDQLPPITAASVGAEPAGAVANHLSSAPHLTSSQVAAIAQSAIATLKQEQNPFPQYQYPGTLGGNKHYRGTTPPALPSIGDTFEEVTATGQWVMSWFWNGTYWLSTQMIFKEASLINNSNSISAYYEISSIYNVFVLWFKANVQLGTNNNTNSQWAFDLFCALATNGGLVLGTSLVTGTSAPSTWYTSAKTINFHINVATTNAKAFVLQATKNGLASAVTGSMQVAYRLARI